MPAIDSSAASLARARASCALFESFDKRRPTTTAPSATGGTRASIRMVRRDDEMNRRPSPPTTKTKLRSPIERFTLTVFWTTVASAVSRLVSSPVLRASKKPISCSMIER